MLGLLERQLPVLAPEPSTENGAQGRAAQAKATPGTGELEASPPGSLRLIQPPHRLGLSGRIRRQVDVDNPRLAH
ncbi:MAG: hypothetical protein OXF96_02545, partial [Chloroflexi bacterium]|nr:hypothetical protein [Chloroflexota bacterium]